MMLKVLVLTMIDFLVYINDYSPCICILFVVVIVVVSVLLLFGIVNCIINLVCWVFRVNDFLDYFSELDKLQLRYVLKNFDKVLLDTSNNTKILENLKCQKSAKDSSRK